MPDLLQLLASYARDEKEKRRLTQLATVKKIVSDFQHYNCITNILTDRMAMSMKNGGTIGSQTS